MENKLTLSELNKQIKDILSEVFSSTVWVVAEISELKENRSGHCYLELVDRAADEITARARATVWSYTYRMLKPYFETSTGQSLTSGLKVMVLVSVEFHEAYGYSLNIKDIDPTYTIGDMALQRVKIINRLKEEGVFEMNKELELPLVPQKIAIISSATAAGYQDFMNQLETNEFGFRFYTRLFQASMQGADTVPSIIQSLEKIFKHEDFFDAVVIIRGGGATADLNSFDNYDLALNISQFPLPVITGIGHEKDDTVIDLVAHTRLKTPTAVAEFLINGIERFYERLQTFQNEILHQVQQKLEERKYELGKVADELNHSVSDFINQKQAEIINKGNRIQKNVTQFSFNKKYELNNIRRDLVKVLSIWFVESKNKAEQKQGMLKRLINEKMLRQQIQLDFLKNQVNNQTKKMLFREKERVHFNENAVRLLNPENVLKRGFTLTLKNGTIIKSIHNLTISDEIITQFSDGIVTSKITKKGTDDN